MKTLAQSTRVINAEIDRTTKIADQLSEIIKKLTGFDRSLSGMGGGVTGITHGGGGGAGGTVIVHENGALEQLETCATDLTDVNDRAEVLINRLMGLL